MKKNVSGQVIGAQMVSATDGSAFTGAVNVYVTKDGGTQAAGSVGSGACTHEGNGFHTYAPAQAETDADHVAFTFVGSGAVPATVQVYPSFPQTGDNFARLGAPAGASLSADVAAVKTQTAAIEVDTQDIQSRLPAALVSGRMDSSVGAIASGVDFSATMKASINTEADTALADVGVTTTVTGRIDTAISTRASAADLATVAGYIDTEVAAIKAKTDNLPSDPADASDIAASFATVNGTLATIDGRIDTEIPAIKQVTDKLHSMLEAAPGSPGESRFTIDALVNAPAGSGGGGGGPSAAQIADAVWDELLADHVGAGSAGAALQDVDGDAEATLLIAQQLATLLEPAGGSPGEYRLSADALRRVLDAIPSAIDNADALLDRDMAAGADTGSPTKRTVRQALRILRNRWTITGATQSVKKEDDSTESWSQTLGTTAGADPVTSTDPAGP